MFHRLFSLCGALGALALILTGCGDDKKTTEPPANPNRVSVETITAAPGDHVTLDVTLHNEVPVQVVQVPLQFVGTGCTIDSVAFADAFRLHLPEPYSWLDADDEPMRVDMINTMFTAVSAGDRLFATIHLTISAQAAAQSIACNSYSYVNDVLGQPALHRLSLATPTGDIIEPSFTSGRIQVVPR